MDTQASASSTVLVVFDRHLSAMSPQFTDDDVGKNVINAEGDEIGIIADVDHGTAHVEPNPGITDTIKAKLGWGGTDDAYPLQESSVADVTADEVHLQSDLSGTGAGMSGAGAGAGTGADTGAGAGTEMDTDTGTGTDAGSSRTRDTGMDTDTGRDTDAGGRTGTTREDRDDDSGLMDDDDDDSGLIGDSDDDNSGLMDDDDDDSGLMSDDDDDDSGLMSDDDDDDRRNDTR